jgi:hypothetical protein
MNIEVTVPDEWSPALTLTVQRLLQEAVRSGWPLIICLRPDVTPEQMADINQRVRGLVQDSGLAA